MDTTRPLTLIDDQKKFVVSSQKEYFFGKNNLVLVVAAEPPAWAVLNWGAYKIISNIVPDKPFSLEELHAELLSRNIKIKKEALQELIKHLVKSLVINPVDKLEIQPNRNLKINGIYFEVTSRCNLSCKHCYAAAGSKEIKDLPQGLILKTIEQIDKPGDIGISGGEPLLRKDCMELLSKIVNNGYQCTLLTNGILATKRISRELAKNSLTAQVSLEGSTAPIHDSIRGEGTYKKVVRGIDNLIEAGCRVRVSFTPTRLNHFDFESLVDFCKAHGVHSIHVCTFTPQGRGQLNRERLQLTSPELYSFQKIVDEIAGNFDIMGNLPETLDLERVGYTWDCCPLGGSIHVGYDGNVYPCEIAANPYFVIGNIYKSSLNDILSSERMRFFVKNSRNRIYNIDECKVCVWRHFCGGGCMVLSQSGTNNIDNIDYLCEMRKKWFVDLLWRKAEHSLEGISGDAG